VEQKPADEGLFGDTDKQGRMFEQRPPVPTFFSAVGRAVEAAKQEKASPAQWLGTLKNTPGVKPEETEWLGLEDWLKQQKGSVTKVQIADYVRANAIEVKEVMKPTVEGAAIQVRLDEIGKEISGLRRTADSGWLGEIQSPGAPQQAGRRIAELEAERERLQGELRGTKFSTYTIPGGENYREMLLTLPPSTIDEAGLLNWTKDYVRSIGENWDELSALEQQEYLSAARVRKDQSPVNFQSSHWDEPNILAHVRFNDRVIDGKKTLLVEEVQSDWHQKGKREGYQSEKEPFPGNFGSYARERGYSEEQIKAAFDRTKREDPVYREWDDKMLRYGETAHSNVPDAPFKTTWPELAMKRMIRYAAENGYEKVAWTTGETQAARYDLSKRLDEIKYVGHGDGSYGIVGFKDDRGVFDTQSKAGKLDDVVGKEIADKIRSGAGEAEEKTTPEHVPWVTLSNLDLKVGGEGMKGFYDQILPATVGKLVKKFSAKIGKAEMEAPVKSPYEIDFEYAYPQGEQPHTMEQQPLERVYHVIDRESGEPQESFESRADAERWVQAREEKSAQPVHTLDITPELRKAATEQGFPLFQRGREGEPQGRVSISENKRIVELFASANHSTLLHEMGHIWLEELVADARRENAPQQLRDDMAATLHWLGVERPEDIGTPQHEQLARGFEQYLRDGKAPSDALESAFAKFKEWLKAIYRSIHQLGAPISDDVRQVFDRMLATDEQIANRSDATIHRGPRAAKGPRAKAEEDYSLLEFLASKGGVKETPDLRAILDGNPFIPGFGRLLRTSGMSEDRAREAAVEAGYIADDVTRAGGGGSTIRDLHEAVADEARGRKRYRLGHAPESGFDPDEERATREQGIAEMLTDSGVDPSLMTSDRLARVVDIMVREHVNDPEAAFERAVMEEAERDADRGQATRPNEFVPGWDVDDTGAAPPTRGALPRLAAAQGRDAGEPARGGGQGDRAATAEAKRAAFELIAGRPGPENEPATLQASQSAAKLPEPAMVKEARKGARASLKAAIDAEQKGLADFEAQAILLDSPDPPVTFGYDVDGKPRQMPLSAAIAEINAREQDTTALVTAGASCLAMAAGAAHG
jgi:hypothetical protein